MFPLSISFGHEALILKTKNKFFKVSMFGQGTLDREITNFKKIIAIKSSIKEILPNYKYFTYQFFSCLVSERLSLKSSNELDQRTIDALTTLNSINNKNRFIKILDYPELQAALTFIKSNFGIEMETTIQDHLEKFFKEGKITTGVCHGDFHSKNVMEDSNGNKYFIDLDCVRYSGISMIDKIHFAVEADVEKRNVLWMQSIHTAIDSKGSNLKKILETFGEVWNPTIGLIYFLDRLGQEIIRYSFFPTKSESAKLMLKWQQILGD